MPRKGEPQYRDSVTRAIALSSGRAMAGTRASASRRIVNDSELRRTAPEATPYRLLGANDLYRRLGASDRQIRENRVYLRGQRNSTRTVHRSDRRDPTTGFGMNVRQVNRYKLGISGSAK